MIVRLKSGSLSEQFFVSPVAFHSGPATNHAVYGQPATVLPLAIPCSGSEVFTIDVSSYGATQSGTLDTAISLLYRDHMSVPSDIRFKMGQTVPVRGGTFEYDVVAATTRQVLDGYRGSGVAGVMDIPAQAKEIVGMLTCTAKDGAVTAAENVNGYIDLWSDVEIGEQEYPIQPLLPGAGTEVEGGAPSVAHYYPMHIGPLPNTNVRVKAYANLHEAVTDSVQIIVNLLWR